MKYIKLFLLILNLSAIEIFIFLLPIKGIFFIYGLLTGGLSDMLVIMLFINISLIFMGSFIFQLIAGRRIRKYMKQNAINIMQFNELKESEKKKIIGSIGLKQYWSQSRF